MMYPRKSFTLIEILIVLGIIALGWCWLPGLINSKATSPQNRFEQNLEQFIARARMEGIARQMTVYFAVNTPLDKSAPQNTLISVGVLDSYNVFQPFAKMAVDPSVTFDSINSSDAGNPGICSHQNDADGTFWDVWAFDGNGKPLQSGGTLIWNIDGVARKWLITDEGALISI